MKKKEKPKRKQTRRNQRKYPNLEAEYNLKTRSDLIDYDYINQLSSKDKAWLDKFTKEYVNASLDSRNPKKNLHNTPELKKDCYDRNNSRNRDILTRAKASGSVIDYLELHKAELIENNNIEEKELIEGLDGVDSEVISDEKTEESSE